MGSPLRYLLKSSLHKLGGSSFYKYTSIRKLCFKVCSHDKSRYNQLKTWYRNQRLDTLSWKWKKNVMDDLWVFSTGISSPFLHYLRLICWTFWKNSSPKIQLKIKQNPEIKTPSYRNQWNSFNFSWVQLAVKLPNNTKYLTEYPVLS